MATLNETRLQKYLEHAQRSLHLHDVYLRQRDPAYQEVMEFVSELVDLMLELRREQKALHEIAARWSECLQRCADGDEDADTALEMCAIARRALGLSLDVPGTPASGERFDA